MFKKGRCDMRKRMCFLLIGIAMYIGVFVISTTGPIATTANNSSSNPRHYHRSIFGHLPTILLYPHSSKSGGGHILTRRQQLHSASLPKSMGFYVNKRYAKRHPRQPLIKWCKKLTYRTVSKPVTALASFPGSGNTWLRYLIQQATGLMTGSVYHDQTLLVNGFPGEGVSDGSVVVVKTHEYNRRNFDKAILLVRDPYDAILAEFNRRSGGHVGHARPKAFKSKEWPSMVNTGANSWERFNLQWIKFFEGDPENLIIVKYSALRNQTEEELRKVMEFLDIDIGNTTMQCVMNYREGRYHRPKKPKQAHMDVFDKNMMDHIDSIKQRVYKKFPTLESS